MASQSTWMSTDRSNLNIYSRTIAVIGQCTITHENSSNNVYNGCIYLALQSYHLTSSLCHYTPRHAVTVFFSDGT